MSTAGRPPSGPVRAIGVIVVALVVLLVGCSDAPTEAEIAKADDGIDPSIVSIFVTEPMLEIVQELGDVFLIQHRGTTFQYTGKPSEDLAKRVAEGFRPAVWIDHSEILAPAVAAGDTIGPPAPVGEDVMQFVVLKDYSGPRPTIEVFGAGPNEAKSGLCDAAVPCGAAAGAILAEAGVTPEPDTVRATGYDIVGAMHKGEFDTSLVYRSEASRLYTIFRVLPLPDPSIGTRSVESISMVDLAVATEFQNWIATSPQAAEILTKRGYRDRDAGPKP